MQTRLVSAIEAGTNTFIGYLVSVAIGQVIYPLFGYPITIGDNFALTAIFVTASYVRSFGFRRLFERYLNKRLVKWLKTLARWMSNERE